MAGRNRRKRKINSRRSLKRRRESAGGRSSNRLSFEQLETRRVLASSAWQAISDQLTVDSGNPDSLVFVDSTLGNSLETLDAGLPVVGLSLDDLSAGKDLLATAISDLQAGLADIESEFGSKATAPDAQLLLFQALGPGGANVLGDRNGNSTIDLADVQVVVNGADVSVTLDLYADETTNPGFDIPEQAFSTGLPGLPLNIESATVDPSLVFEYKELSFGTQSGAVFLDTSNTNEILLHVDAVVDAVNVSGNLGFLEIVANDSAVPSSFSGTLSIDVGGDIAGGLDLAMPVLDGTADVQLAVEAFVSSSRVAGDPGLDPALSTLFELDWNFVAESDLQTLNDELGEPPILRFGDVRLDLSPVAEDILAPIVQEVKQLTDPLSPVLDILTEPVPLISDIAGYVGGSAVSLLDLAELFDINNQFNFPLQEANALLKLVATGAEMLDAIDEIQALAASEIELGSFTFEGAGTDIRNLSLVDYTNDTHATSQLSISSTSNPSNPVFDQLDSLLPSGIADMFVPQSGSNPYFDFSFPIFEDPGSSVFSILIGQDADLIRLDGGFGSGIEFTPPSVPLFSVGIVTIEMTPPALSLTGNFGLGYDTFGLRQFISGGPSAQPALLLDGFYVDTDSSINLSVSAELNVVGNFFFISAGAGGEIGLQTEMIVNSSGDEIDNDPAKTRFRSADTVYEYGFCGGGSAAEDRAILKVTGGLYAGLNFEVKIGVDIPLVGFVGVSFQESTGGRIIDFGDIGCINPFQADATTELASFDPSSGELRLNIGDTFAPFRNFKSGEVDESYVISADPVDPANYIQVAAFGIVQTYPRPTTIVGNAGSGDDSITVRASVGDVAVILTGGDGNDELRYGGSGTAELDGGGFDDLIVGGSGTNLLYGDWGNDEIVGGYASTSSNFIEGGNGHDRIIGGNGTNVIYGGEGDDFIQAGPNGDLMYGGRGSDHIILGPGSDQAYGEEETDVFTWFIYEELETEGFSQTDYVDGGLTGRDRVEVRTTSYVDLIQAYAGTASSGFAPAFVNVLSPGVAGTVEMDNIEVLSLDGAGDLDQIEVYPLYTTTIEDVSVNAGDTLSEYETGDITILYGIDNPSTGSAGDSVETIHVGNEETALAQQCAQIVYELVNNELKDWQSFYDCEHLIHGVTRVDFELEIDAGQQLIYDYRVHVTNQTQLQSSGEPEDHLYIESLGGDDTISVNSVTGPTTIGGGDGDDWISTYLVPLEFNFDTSSYYSNSYFGELTVDAGPGLNTFAFDASRFESTDGSPWSNGGFTIQHDRIQGDEHIQYGIEYFATSGDFDFILITANKESTDFAVQSTRGNSITVLAVNNDDVRVSSTADFSTVGSGGLSGVNGHLILATGPIESISGQANLHFSDRDELDGNSNVEIGRIGPDTFITNYAGANNDALIQINSTITGQVDGLRIDGSDSHSLAEEFHLYDATGNFVELVTHDGPDTVNIHGTSVPVIIDSGAGTDTIRLGSAAYSGLDNIFADVIVNFRTGFDDSLIIDDRSSSAMQNYVFATGNILRSDHVDISFAGADIVQLKSTEFDDTIDLRSYTALGLNAPNLALNGNGGNDFFMAPDAINNSLIFDGPDRFLMNRRIAADAIENVAGGNRNDTFRIVRSGSISGILYGGVNPNAGFDRIDYRFHRQPVAVNLASVSATDVGNFVFIDSILGSPSGADVITGYDVPTVWDITSNNGGSVSWPDGTFEVEFSSFENLNGGIDIDLFSFSDGNYVTGLINGTAGSQIDSLDFLRYTTSIAVNLQNGSATSAHGMNMQVVGIEAASGGSGNDQLIGDAGDNILFGNGGHDLIDGRSGNDLIDGGDGRDFLIGGTGSDTIDAGSGEDIVVGSEVFWSVNDLQLILDYWSDESASFDYQQRTSALYNGDLGNVWLNPTVVSFDDDTDVLTGGSELDWFWIDGFDSIIDLEAGEIFEEV